MRKIRFSCGPRPRSWRHRDGFNCTRSPDRPPILVRKRFIEDKADRRKSAVMKRRDFLGALAAGAVSLRHRAGLAQQQSKTWRVGIIEDGPLWIYFRDRLRDLGGIDGQNVTIE